MEKTGLIASDGEVATTARPAGDSATVNLLDLAPDLAERVDSDDRELAERVLTLPTLDLGPGRWNPRPDFGLGLLVAEGALIRRVRVSERSGIEILLPGDVLRPGQEDAASFCSAEFEVLIPTRLAILEDRVAAAMARWPALADYLIGSALRRARILVAAVAIDSIAGIERRLLALLWMLAERSGEVTPDGVALRLPITHRHLAELVGSRRPSVTSALGALQRSGLVERRDDCWLLTGSPPEELFERYLKGERSRGSGRA